MQWNKEEFQNDLVSVVTPVYNGSCYLRRFLNSILNSTWPYIELILVDDGSEDGTVQIAESYEALFAEKDISYRIVKEKHVNASHAVSAGLKYVSGEYLIWPDADDELKEDSIEKRVTYLKEHPEYHGVRSSYMTIDDTTGLRRSDVERNDDPAERRLFFPIIEGRTYVCCGCYMLRSRAFFAEYPDRNIPVSDFGQNYQMLLPFCYHNECFTIDEELYIVHRRPDSHSNLAVSTKERCLERHEKRVELLEEIIKICHIENSEEIKRIHTVCEQDEWNLAVAYRDRKRAVRVYKRHLRMGLGLKRWLRETRDLIYIMLLG